MTHSASSWYVIKRFLIIFLPLCFLTSGISTLLYLTNVRTDKAIHENNEVQSISQKQEIVKSNFDSIISDLMILSAHHELYVFLESNEPVHRKNISKEFLEFCYYKSIYDQVRLLDGTGMEVVRVDFNNGKPRIIPDEQL